MANENKKLKAGIREFATEYWLNGHGTYVHIERIPNVALDGSKLPMAPHDPLWNARVSFTADRDGWAKEISIDIPLNVHIHKPDNISFDSMKVLNEKISSFFFNGSTSENFISALELNGPDLSIDYWPCNNSISYHEKNIWHECIIFYQSLKVKEKNISYWRRVKAIRADETFASPNAFSPSMGRFQGNDGRDIFLISLLIQLGDFKFQRGE